ncbi:3178_t:CDS:1, partial [Cetraspora pellucida]
HHSDQIQTSSQSNSDITMSEFDCDRYPNLIVMMSEFDCDDV